jgi:peptidoglycan lytic transglycosylase
MYVPVTLTLSAAPLGAVGVMAGPSTTADPSEPTDTALSVRHANLNVLAGHATTIAGRLLADGAPEGRPSGLADGVVALQVRRHSWRTVAWTHTGAGGRYRLRYVPGRIGSVRVRVRFGGNAEDRGSRRLAGRLNVYRLAGASWYGGGGSLACGGWLTSSTLGVANKTLPCGTLLTLRYGGRTVRVRVIDRGPYVAGREFDLTEATKRALGFGDTGDVWATS